MAKAKYTLEKTPFSGPEITKYVTESIKAALGAKSSINEDEMKDMIRRVRLRLSMCKSETEMVACGETLLQDVNSYI